FTPLLYIESHITLHIQKQNENHEEEEEIKQKNNMGLLDNLWDDVVAGPQPDNSLGRLRRIGTKPLSDHMCAEGESGGIKLQKSPAMPASPSTPATPGSATKDNVWRSVFNPGSNLATRSGHAMYDNPQPNSPTVYDW
ncbi:Dormancy-associated protein 1, partial [Linum perenne]